MHSKAAFGGIMMAAALSACTAVPASTPPQPGFGTRTARPPQPAQSDGAESIMGRSAEAVIALLGTPRLDVQEGQARKLQFVGTGCVVDAYLYPQDEGGARVTYVEARRSDGVDADRRYCVEALQQR